MKSKLNWTLEVTDNVIEEEQFLKRQVQQGKYDTWTQIAELMNSKFPTKHCTGKQYRERYVNHTQFGSHKTVNFAWNQLEEQTLFDLYQEHGPSWSIISLSLPHKSQNCLKNKFYGSIRKMLRKLNRIGRQANEKVNKLVKYEAIIRIIDAAEGAEDLPVSVKTDSIEIREKMLELSHRWPDTFSQQSCLNLIKSIYRFNIATRCYNAKKWKRKVKSLGGQSSASTRPSPNPLTGELSDDCQGANPQQFSSEPALQLPPLHQQQEKTDRPLMLEKFSLLAYEYRSLSFSSFTTNINDELEEDLCKILQQEYVPCAFEYFE